MKYYQTEKIQHIQDDYFIEYYDLTDAVFSKDIWGEKHATNPKFYSVSCIISGKFKAKQHLISQQNTLKKEYILQDRSVIISPPDEYEEFEMLSQSGEFIRIDFHPIIFKNTSDEKDIFKIFKYANVTSVYNTNDFSSDFFIKCVDALKYCLKNDKGRFHTLLRIRCLVSQLKIEIDNILGESKQVEDNVIIKTITYIKENYTKNLTLDSVSDYLGISKSSVNRICKRMQGQTFLEYLTDIRLNKANELLKTSDYNLKTIAVFCGFNTYNTFYYAYVKKFGFPPSAKQTKQKNTKWPFETSNFDFHKEYN